MVVKGQEWQSRERPIDDRWPGILSQTCQIPSKSATRCFFPSHMHGTSRSLMDLCETRSPREAISDQLGSLLCIASGRLTKGLQTASCRLQLLPIEKQPSA